MSSALIISSLTNVPIDRLLKKIENVRSAVEYDQEAWKRIAHILGWSEWNLMSKAEKDEVKKIEKKRKKSTKKKTTVVRTHKTLKSKKKLKHRKLKTK